jgi:hypothetical protein
LDADEVARDQGDANGYAGEARSPGPAGDNQRHEDEQERQQCLQEHRAELMCSP